MRTALVLLIATVVASADTASWIRDQRRLAADQRDAHQVAEATETLRLCVAAARRDRLHAEAARCLSDLAEIRYEAEAAGAAEGKDVPMLAGRLMAEAAREAAAAGDVGLEAACLVQLEVMGNAPDGVDVLDAAVLARDFQWLGDQLFFERDVQIAFDLLDAIAAASLQEGGLDLVAAADTLDSAIEAAEKAGLSLTPATLRLRSARLRLDAHAADTTAIRASLEKALAFFDGRGCASGRSEARLLLSQAGGTPGVLPQALLDAREAGDPGLEARILQALARDAEASVRDPLLAAAGQAEERRRRAVLERAERAIADSEGAVGAAEELRAEITGRPDDDEEVHRLLSALGFGGPPPRRALPGTMREHLVALLRGDSCFGAYAGLETVRAHDAWPVLAEEAPRSERPDVALGALESLATREDLPKLFGLTASEDKEVASAAAAAIFRLATEGALARPRLLIEGTPDPLMAALERKPGPGVVLYLLGVLARRGDASALQALRDALASDDAETRWHASVILGRLGFASPLLGLGADRAPSSAITRLRILARAPSEWGPHIVMEAAGEDAPPWMAARANQARGVRDRVLGLDEEDNIWSLIFRLPRTPEEGRICGTAWITRIADELWNDASGDTLTWVTEGLGLDFHDGEGKLRKRAGNPIADFALEDLEFRRFGAIAGAQTRVLTIGDRSAWATLRCTVVPKEGEIVDNALRLPFQVKYRTSQGTDGSLAGAIGGVAISITLSTLFPEAEVRIPGFAPIAGEVGMLDEDGVVVSAPLPVEGEGEGLATGKLIPLEKIAEGTVTLRLRVDKARASMTFPLAFLVPPKKDKPDLVAAELVVEPSVPRPGEETTLTLRARNVGKAVEKGGVLSVRFSVLNPQSGEGKRTIDVRLFGADGWRPGEWKTFEARPKVVQDWYMNKYAMSWTLEMGDTRLSARIDADGKLEEMDEGNNVCEIDVPLYVPDEEGKKAGEDELLGKLAAILEQVRAATTDLDARVQIGVMRTLLKGAHVSTPATEVACRHVEAAVEMQVHRLRVDEALRQVEELAKDPAANQERLKAIHAELVGARTAVLDSGVPVTKDTITWWRNRVQATANAAGSAGEYGELSGILTGVESETPDALKKVSESLNRLDGVLQLMRYARDRVKGGDADNGDAIQGMISIAGSAPGMSKLHQAMLQAEIDYVDKGFRKEANALEALGDLIEGKQGAQERLDAAVKDVEGHVGGGPFNEAARKNIILGAVKDVPVLGKLVDMILSWK